MVHGLDALLLALCLAFAALALLRGVAGVLVARELLPRLESVTLTLAGVAGLIGVLIVGRFPH